MVVECVDVGGGDHALLVADTKRAQVGGERTGGCKDWKRLGLTACVTVADV